MTVLEPWPDDDELAALLDGIGYEISEADMSDEWPVEGLIHPGLTCVLGQPNRGKTSLLITLCHSLLSGDEWLGRTTSFAPNRRILFFCEDRSSVVRVRRSLAAFIPGRLRVFGLHRWALGVNLSALANRADVGLVVIDSAFAAAGNVNDQDRADAFIGALQAVTVPVVVVHHEAKGEYNNKPIGAQRFAAAYRHAIRVAACKSRESGWMRLDLEVSGNDVPGLSKWSVSIDRDSLLTKAADPEASPRRPARLSGADKAYVLGCIARERDLPAGLGHREYAALLLGGSRGKEDAVRRREIGEKLGVKGDGPRGQSVENIIRDHREDFERGINGD